MSLTMSPPAPPGILFDNITSVVAEWHSVAFRGIALSEVFVSAHHQSTSELPLACTCEHSLFQDPQELL